MGLSNDPSWSYCNPKNNCLGKTVFRPGRHGHSYSRGSGEVYQEISQNYKNYNYTFVFVKVILKTLLVPFFSGYSVYLI